MKYYIIFGPPGAGKGTHSELLVKKFSFLHISTGDLLRREIAKESEIGKKVKSLIDNGELADDETVLRLIENVIICPALECRGFILDGYPRNLKQALELDKLLAKRGSRINGVISLIVDEDTIVGRIRRRALIENRKDDLETETILHRIKTYHTCTEPLIDYYKSKGCYYSVDGSTTIEEGFESICRIIERLNSEQQ
ncbi:MAG: adenylate kinase [Bacteroidales bacterium]|nr:adenylate kinase [Bacteroidales bacterium]MDD2424860.1 adenylate kinase [Bacteroidales bacterium]MDD3990086.1 adenylate kinase [Bacteroidales bacterium]MDD4639533.1 adenylate kinase [Bacteroidales bacterium]